MHYAYRVPALCRRLFFLNYLFFTHKNSVIMKTTLIEEIANAIANERNDLFDERSYDQITDFIFWAWDNWNSDIIASYYEGKKPENPTFAFRKNWVINELVNNAGDWVDLIGSFFIKPCVSVTIFVDAKSIYWRTITGKYIWLDDHNGIDDYVDDKHPIVVRTDMGSIDDFAVYATGVFWANQDLEIPFDHDTLVARLMQSIIN